MMESERFGSEAAIAEVASAAVDVSQRLALPVWFHVGLGILVAQHALVAGLASNNSTIPSFLALVCGAAMLVALARRTIGITVATPRGPRSRGLMAARTLAALVCIWGAAIADTTLVAIFAGIVAFVATALLGITYDKALQRDVAERGIGR